MQTEGGLDAALAGDVSQLDASPAGDAGPVCPDGSIDPDLLAWYPFDEGAGNVVKDCSPSGYHGTAIGAVAGLTRVAGKKGGAISLDGDTACIDIGTAPTLAFTTTSFTVASWIKPRRYSLPGGDSRWIFSRHGAKLGSTNDRGYHLGTDEPTGVELDLTVEPTGDSFESQTGITPGDWVHVAGVFENPTITVYVNGVRSSTRSGDAGGVTVTNDPAAHGRIGCRAGLLKVYDGDLDDLRIYGRALSPSEISDLAR